MRKTSGSGVSSAGCNSLLAIDFPASTKVWQCLCDGSKHNAHWKTASPLDIAGACELEDEDELDAELDGP